MITKDYYFLASILPELQIGYPPDISFQSFDFLMKTNLTPEDYRQAMVMRRYYDLQNIRALWKEEDLDPRGNYDLNELEDALVTRMGLQDYVFSFLDKYESDDMRLKQFPELIAFYYQREIENAEGFLKEYLVFEREWRLVLTGFRAKKQQRDILLELQHEDPQDDIVAQILAQKDAKSYEPPTRYGDLKVIFDEYSSRPFELHQALCDYRFQKIEEMYGIELFSIDRILVYLAQLIIVEKWLELDKKKGLEVIETIVKDAT